MELLINPASDSFTQMQITALNKKLYAELSIYKHTTPTKLDLKRTEESLYTKFNASLLLIGTHSYIVGCEELKVTPENNYKTNILNNVKQRSRFAAHSIVSTAALAFGELYAELEFLAAVSKKTVTSKKRSKSTAEYEGNRIFFEQRSKSWRLRAGLLKAWYPTSSNVCPNCEDNEEEGKIPVDQAFPSGDFFAPAHINCDCYIGITL